ncbi:hypothetical protein ACKI2N_010030 [Cupriavidus sp. 30B13]
MKAIYAVSVGEVFYCLTMVDDGAKLPGLTSPQENSIALLQKQPESY